MVEPISSINLHLGERVRLRRRACGLSQQRLAEALGLTFQQIQKYEGGTNRISASKLFGIAEALDVPIAYFYEGLPPGDGEQDAPPPPRRFVAEALFAAPGGELMATAFVALRQPRLQRSLAQFVKALAADDPHDATEAAGPCPSGDER